MQKHSVHKAVCDRKRVNMMAVYIVFTNSQPSAVDGLKDVLRLISHCFRTAHKYGNVSGIYVVTTNLYRTPKFCGAADL